MKITSAILSVLFYASINAQAPAIQWQKCLGGTGRDVATCIRTTYDGGYILAGSTNSTNGDITGNHGGFDGWIAKLNDTGKIVWSKCFGGSANDSFKQIIQTRDSGFIAVGYTASSDGDITGLSKGKKDALVVRLDKNGNTIWKKAVGGSQDDWFNSVVETKNGDFAMVGQVKSADKDLDTFFHSNWNSFLHAFSYSWFYKINAVGNFISTNCWVYETSGTTVFSDCFGLNELPSGYSCFMDELYNHSSTGSGGGYSGYFYNFRILDSFGSPISSKKFRTGMELNGLPYKKNACASLQLNNSTFYIFGMYSKQLTQSIPPWLLGSYSFDISKVINTPTSFSILPQNNFYTEMYSNSTTPKDVVYGSAFTNNNDIIIAGHTKGSVMKCGNCALNDTFPTLNHTNTLDKADFWLVCANTNGSYKWQKCYGGSNNDYLFDFQNTKDSGYIAIGETNSNDGDVSGNHGDADIWVVKYNSQILPLKLISFSAKLKNSNVLLSWQTSNEINVSHFNIQRSFNGKDFIAIGNVSANGNFEYSFDDKEINSVKNKLVIFYRLEIVDNDGSKHYSLIERVLFNNKNEQTKFRIFPNPTNGSLTIEANNYKELLIYNAQGKVVYKLTGNNQSTIINTKQFAKGVYFVKAILNNGDVKIEKLLVE